jgi:hypothetical protein
MASFVIGSPLSWSERQAVAMRATTVPGFRFMVR